MADITLATAGKINVLDSGPTVQATAPCAAAISAGSPVLYDANGKWIVADANDLAADGIYGISSRAAVIGEALTVIRQGAMDGWSDLPAPGSRIYVSDNVGRLATTAGSASLVVGIVEAVHGANVGTAADRVLRVECLGLVSV